jgi:ABC-type sugar transport system, permease component
MAAIGKDLSSKTRDNVQLESVLRRRLRIVAYILLSIGAITMIVPFLWMLSTSFKTMPEITRGTFLPHEPTLDNYRQVLTTTTLPLWYWNTIVVAVISTASVVFFDTLAGYVFAKFDFPLKMVFFLIILSTLMIPTEMLLIPWYILSVQFNWVDTYWGIAFPGMITAAGVFLMRQFFHSVPNELLDAARIDGMPEFQIFTRVGVPLVMPAMASLFIFNFLGNWNAFQWPLIVTSKKEMMTLPVGISFFASEASTQWNLIMTGASLSVVPLLIVVIIFQRQIIDGIALTGLKG